MMFCDDGCSSKNEKEVAYHCDKQPHGKKWYQLRIFYLDSPEPRAIHMTPSIKYS